MGGSRRGRRHYTGAPMTVVLASAADERYGDWLLNLVGSVHANANVFDRIEVYDLGLGRMQRRRLAAARGVELLTVPSFVPHWRQGFTWKTWIWRHAETETLLARRGRVGVAPRRRPARADRPARLLRRVERPQGRRHRPVGLLRAVRPRSRARHR